MVSRRSGRRGGRFGRLPVRIVAPRGERGSFAEPLGENSLLRRLSPAESASMRGMLAANFRAQPNHLIPVCISVVVHHAKGHTPERKTGVFARAHDTIEKSVRLREELKDNL